MTTILLVDDHPVVRDGYKRLFERRPGWTVVAEADTAAGAYQAYRKANPDVVVMDLSLPGPGGLEAVRHIRQWDRDARIMVLTMHGSAAFALKAFEAGATGYATKGSDAAEVVELLARVARGEKALSTDISRELAADRLAEDRPPLHDLGPRETEILRLLASGSTATEIADALNVSLKTIHNYSSTIRAKLGARTDASLVLLAIKAGLVSTEMP
jgi:two-component system invasion response regulator UvrY